MNTGRATGMFTSVLVANRGEIACRIITTLRALGIRSIAIYSDADAGARHVRMADAAVRVGPAAPQSSYLDAAAIVAAAGRAGAQAVHPGYGFLSENAEFARLCESADLVFIGPPVAALELMGDKIRAKAHVASLGVPTISGSVEAGLTDEQLADAASGIGFPVLVKPSAGGGGKGMHVVTEAAALAGTLVTARRVALAAFGDDALLIERYIDSPRHIEVQVLADGHGTVIHLGERECSLQRRHQKVIEEAPSAVLDAPTRERMGEAACAIARSVDYRGAGTVEFLVAADAPDDFFFMEMNTRLQVEHPVTELVTGVDLVEWQVRIAAGEQLTLAQSDVALSGHSVEARLYAENPARGFLPTAGAIIGLIEASGPGVRVDSSLTTGLTVAPDYDPLLAKIIAWGPDRTEALARLERALAATRVLGIATNLEFLLALVRLPAVRAGELDTSLIERELPHLAFAAPDDAALATAALTLHASRPRLGVAGPWRDRTGWRLGDTVPVSYTFAHGDDEQTVRVFADGTVAVGDGERSPARLAERVVESGAARVALEHAGGTDEFTVAVDRGADGEAVWLARGGVTLELRVRDRVERLARALAGVSRPDGAASPDVRSPMPGTIVSVPVATGDVVDVGAVLLVVEAMKMEHSVVAQVAGTVTIGVASGDVVRPDQILASIAPPVVSPAEPRPAVTNPHEGDTP